MDIEWLERGYCGVEMVVRCNTIVDQQSIILLLKTEQSIVVNIAIIVISKNFNDFLND